MATRASPCIRKAFRLYWRLPSLKDDAGLLEGVGVQQWTHQQYRQKQRLAMVLTSNVESLGRPGQIIQVAPGYARNKLMPQKLALPAIQKFLEKVEADRKNLPVDLTEKGKKPGNEGRVVSVDDILKEAEEVARRLDAGRLTIRCNTPHKSNVVRKSITAAVIVDEVKRQMGIELAEANIDMPSDFTTIGDYEVTLRFPRGVKLPGEKEQIRLDVHLRRK